MIGYYKTEEPFEFSIGQAVMSRRFEKIEITKKDFLRINEMKQSKVQSEMLIEWLADLYCRFTPDAK